MLQYPRGGLAEISPANVGFDCCRLVTFGVHQDRRAASAAAGSNVAPSVSYKVTIGEGDVVRKGSSVQHAWRGLAAGATVSIVVVADEDIVKGQHFLQVRVNRLNLISRGESPDDIWLVCDYNEYKTGAMQVGKRFGYAWENLEIGHGEWRLGLTGAEDLPVDHAVAVEEHGPPHRICSSIVGAVSHQSVRIRAES